MDESSVSNSYEEELADQILEQNEALQSINEAIEVEASEDLMEVPHWNRMAGSFIETQIARFPLQMQRELVIAIQELESAMLAMKKSRLMNSLMDFQVSMISSCMHQCMDVHR